MTHRKIHSLDVDWLGKVYRPVSSVQLLYETPMLRIWGGLFVAPPPEAQDRIVHRQCRDSRFSIKIMKYVIIIWGLQIYKNYTEYTIQTQSFFITRVFKLHITGTIKISYILLYIYITYKLQNHSLIHVRLNKQLTNNEIWGLLSFKAIWKYYFHRLQRQYTICRYVYRW